MTTERAREVLAKNGVELLGDTSSVTHRGDIMLGHGILAAMLAYAAEVAAQQRAAGREEAARVAEQAVTYVVGEQRDLCDRIAAAIRAAGDPQ